MFDLYTIRNHIDGVICLLMGISFFFLSAAGANVFCELCDLFICQLSADNTILYALHPVHSIQASVLEKNSVLS